MCYKSELNIDKNSIPSTSRLLSSDGSLDNNILDHQAPPQKAGHMSHGALLQSNQDMLRILRSKSQPFE